MTRYEVFELISKEREYQNGKWGADFDDKNTANDWVAYITAYLGKALTYPWDKQAFQDAILQVAALAVATLEQNEYSPRHYDHHS